MEWLRRKEKMIWILEQESVLFSGQCWYQNQYWITEKRNLAFWFGFFFVYFLHSRINGFWLFFLACQWIFWPSKCQTNKGRQPELAERKSVRFTRSLQLINGMCCFPTVDNNQFPTGFQSIPILIYNRPFVNIQCFKNG